MLNSWGTAPDSTPRTLALRLTLLGIVKLTVTHDHELNAAFDETLAACIPLEDDPNFIAAMRSMKILFGRA